LGSVPDSGLKLKKAFARFDGLEQLETELDLADLDDQTSMPEGCRCAEVLTGRLIPPECPLFDGACTPSSPVGPCMVSSEGSCAAYYLYER
jgi:hydrogenase expression/formation protein HypD